MPGRNTVIDAAGLEIRFATPSGVATAVRGVSLSIEPGEAVGLVGESGSGKSVTALSLLRLLPRRGVDVRAERLTVAGVDVLNANAAALSRIRGAQVAMVFQDPLRALTPTRRVADQITEMLRRHERRSKRQAKTRAIELLERVGIPDAGRRAHGYPHQFSGGQRQRIMIAIAIACRPQVLIADEPTTALDVTTQAQIFDLLLELREELAMSLLLITHDLSVVARVCDRVLVMYAGRLVEQGATRDIFRRPGHPYTAGLLRCIPRLDQPGRAAPPIPGESLDALTRIDGCAFAPRCVLATTMCNRRPELAGVGAGHDAACWHSEKVR